MIQTNKEKHQYFKEMHETKFKHEDLRPICKAWGRKGKEAQQDCILIQRLYDGIIMYTERYAEMKYKEKAE